MLKIDSPAFFGFTPATKAFFAVRVFLALLGVELTGLPG